MGRVVAWILAGLLAIGASFVAGDLVDPFERGGSTPVGAGAPAATQTTDSEEPTPEPTADPDDATSYFTTDGSAPQLTPECSGAMGLCIGGPVDHAVDAFGIEDERSEGQQPGSILRAWNMQDIRLVVAADDIGSITSVSVSIPNRLTGVRIALPEGLVLGTDTMDKVLRVFGKPIRRDDFAAENVWFYIYVFNYGPEATHQISFTHSNEGGPIEEAELGARRVTGFSAAYAS